MTAHFVLKMESLHLIYQYADMYIVISIYKLFIISCFKEVIETIGECPTCSKKLTLKDIMSVQSNSIEV